MPRPHGESHRKGKHTLADSDPQGVPDRNRLPPIPDRPCIVESLERAIPIVYGVMGQTVSPNGIDLVLVPPAKVIAIPSYKAIRERRPAGDGAHGGGFGEFVLTV